MMYRIYLDCEYRAVSVWAPLLSSHLVVESFFCACGHMDSSPVRITLAVGLT